MYVTCFLRPKACGACVASSFWLTMGLGGSQVLTGDSNAFPRGCSDFEKCPMTLLGTCGKKRSAES